MIRLMVQFKSSQPFSQGLQLLAIYDDANKAVEDGIAVYDDTVDSMFINRGDEWLMINPPKNDIKN